MSLRDDFLDAKKRLHVNGEDLLDLDNTAARNFIAQAGVFLGIPEEEKKAEDVLLPVAKIIEECMKAYDDLRKCFGLPLYFG